ncbi:RNA polymerase sigma factor SigJ [Aneurinibacillus uraniidurans]|uniref:RNA polymerase sigma factor SigJ n=1 Tax=Aneurinibacillus uraniidurans TaxID=2966586 RepID=UPI002348EE90|nr:RNA polymerase sigma factor SigJ [Aneurinibacillus sp. B1]WCN36559.1 RNA polymerase sigma factor SigJ [Aneurinibacillus sp. B1]
MKQHDLELNELYTSYKSYLISIAYQMLGSLVDAEDIVHDTFVRLQINGNSQVDITSIKSYISKMVINRCINEVKSSRKKRETYVGTWLPEPIVHGSQIEPSEQVVQNEQLYYAFVVLMERLSTAERVVYVLREALHLKHSEIADMLHITEPNCRKMFGRAKKKMTVLPNETDMSYQTQQSQVTTFISALSRGDIQGISDILTSDVILVADGGGKVVTAINQIASRKRVLVLLHAIATKFFSGKKALAVRVNNQPGILVTKNDEAIGIFSFAWNQNTNKIERIFYIVNPDKLKHIIVCTSHE